jgi:hypothetical protein
MERNPHEDEERDKSLSFVPPEVPDPVETRDSMNRAVRPSPGQWAMFLIPAALIVAIGISWMMRAEGSKPGGTGPYAVTGTSGERSNDPEGGARGEDAPLNPTPRPAVISDVELLTSKADYTGHSVQLLAAPVLSVAGPRTFWIGRPTNRTLVLVTTDVKRLGALKPGQLVGIAGRLEPVPNDDQLDRAGFSPDDKKAIADEDVIIRATRVEPRSQQAAPYQATTPAEDRSVPKQ